MKRDKITVNDFKKKKESGEKITAITAYDKITAELVSDSGIDLILVGDSLGMVILGYETTIPVTLEEMIHHTKAVMRGVGTSFTCIDMPFMTYQANVNSAIENCGRAIKETRVESVKVEGLHSELIERLVSIGIPVLGHIGFVPQSFHRFGGYRIIGKDTVTAKRLLQEAREIEDAGAYALVIECVPAEIAGLITNEVSIPTIGIGSGPHCDGQIIVIHDILGLYKPTPKHVKVYYDVSDTIKEAVKEYVSEVKSCVFPERSHTYNMKKDEFEKLKKDLK